MTLKKAFSTMFVCIFLCTSISYADDSSVINYQGQPQEVIKLSKKVVSHIEVQEPYEATCTREVPDGTTHPECEDVEVGYDTQCRDIPPQRRCETRYNTQCQDVTRTERLCTAGRSERICSRSPVREVCSDGPSRQDCSNGPSREVCSNGPAREVCSNSPSREVCSSGPSREVCTPGPSSEVCTNTPSREVCTESPVREVCSTNPRSGERVCRNVGGERTCRQVGGERSCRTVPGNPVCRSVPGQRTCQTIPGERSCHNVPGERSCHNVPGERTCRDIPGPRSCHQVGGEEICRDVQGADICRDVPRTERVCNQVPYEDCYMTQPDQVCSQIPRYENQCVNVPNLRTEEYKCTQYRDVTRTVETLVNHDVTIDFESNIDLDIQFTVEMDKDGEDFKISSDANQNNLVIFYNKVKETEANGTESSLELVSHIKINILQVKATVGVSDLTKLKLNSILLHRQTDSVDFGLSQEIDKLRMTLDINRRNGDHVVTLDQDIISLVSQGIMKKRKLGTGFVYTMLLENLMNFHFKQLGRYDVKINFSSQNQELNLPKGIYIYKKLPPSDSQQKLIEKKNLSTVK